jgi:iron complex outermembrane receptor protein
VRYNKDKKTYDSQRLFGFDGPLALGAAVSSSAVTGDASANYRVTDDLHVYARIAKGYKPPAIEASLLFADNISQVKAETTISYETGVKSTLFGGKAMLNFDVYTFHTDNAQLTSFGGQSNVVELQNVRRVDAYGFESDAEFKPVSALLITAGLSYNHTRIDDPNFLSAVCGNGCTVTNPTEVINGTTVANINGNPLQNAPELIEDLTAKYSVPVSDTGKIYVFTDWKYRSSILLTAYKSLESNGAPLLQGGLRLGYSNTYAFAAGTTGYDVSVFVRNITNDVKITGIVDFDNFGGYVNDPRTFGVSAKLTF